MQSYNGWTVDADRSAIGVVAFSPLGVPFPAGVKGGDVETVFTYLVKEFHRRVERLINPGCWGFNYKRNVNNPDVYSCHASATAIDLNAPLHPNSRAFTFTREQAAEIRKILAELRGVVRWLEGYDEMHFEIKGNALEVAYVARLIESGTLLAPTPPTKEAIVAVDQETLGKMLNESEGQIASAIRNALESAVEEITGGVRTRDAKGNVIDGDPQHVSNADLLSKQEVMFDNLTKEINKGFAAVVTALNNK